MLEGLDGPIQYEEVDKKIRPIQIPQPNKNWDASKIKEFLNNIGRLQGAVVIEVNESEFAVQINEEEIILYPLAQKYGISGHIINFQETINLLKHGFFFRAMPYYN